MNNPSILEIMIYIVSLNRCDKFCTFVALADILCIDINVKLNQINTISWVQRDHVQMR